MIDFKHIFVLLLFLFSSCEKEMHPPYSNKTIKIVVQGEISHELGVEVMVGRALPAFVSLPLDSMVINDALVVLAEDGVVLDTLVNVDTMGGFRLSKPVDIATNHTYSLLVDADGLPSVYTQGAILPSTCLSSWDAIYVPVSSEEGRVKVFFSCNPETDKNLFLRISAWGNGDTILPFRRFGPPEEENDGCEPVSYGTNSLSSSCYDMSDGHLEFSFEKKVFSYLYNGEYDVKKIRLEFITTEGDSYFGGVSVGNIGFEEPNLTSSSIVGGYGYFYPKDAKVILLEL